MSEANEDFTFGCRSGIQKAVRRGDLSLARTCFETLWSEKTDRQWFRWRLPIIIVEEAWFFLGEYGKFLASRPGEDEVKWKKFIYRLVLVLKNKDASALHQVVTWAPDLPQQGIIPAPLLREFLQMQTAIATSSEPADVVESYVQALGEIRELSPYESEGLRRIVNRAFSGGMLCDRWFILASVILTHFRGIDPKQVRRLEQQGLARWKQSHGNKKPKIINLPWYVFDMHTRMGKIVMGILMKRKAQELGIKSKDDLIELWFNLESGKVPKDFCFEKKFKDVKKASTVDFWDSYWWPINRHLLKVLPSSNKTPWAKRWPPIQKELENVVKWLAEKRGCRLG